MRFMIGDLPYILQWECLFVPARLVLVGVSGGPDSLCLLDLLQRLGYPLVVAHLNHGLRPEAAEEAEMVRRLAQTRHLPFVLERVDTQTYAKTQSLSLEEAARELRYRFLFEQAARFQAQAVAVGHTADDQVETVLMHLLRGSGLAGLRGMAYRLLPNPWSQEIPLARPLLGVWREQVIAYCQEHGLQPVFDPSNLDTKFYRNRLRHEWIPVLESAHPHLRRRLWQMSRLLAEDYDLIQKMVDAAWEECILEQGTAYLGMNRLAVQSLPPALQRHLLRRAIAALQPALRDLDLETVERGIAFISSPKGKCNLAAGLFLLAEGGRLWLAHRQTDLPRTGWPFLPPGDSLTLTVPGKLNLPQGWVLEAEWVKESRQAENQARQNRNPYRAWLDADAVSLPLIVRTRRPGERFHPLGMEGHSIKVSDLMINLKIPSRARPGWPLVCAGEQIVWIPGYRLAQTARLNPDTRRAISLYLKPGVPTSS